MAPASLSSLPNELLFFVVNDLQRFKDIACLARTDRRFYNIVNPLLYQRAVSERDAWPLAWASHCGVEETLRKILDAGANPNHHFVDGLPIDDWGRNTTAAKNSVPKPTDQGDDVWESDNEGETDGHWSPETDDSEHTGTLNTTQPSSATTSSNPNVWGEFDNDSDGDTEEGSVLHMDDPFADTASDDSSSTLDHAEQLARYEWRTNTTIIIRHFRPLHLAARAGHNHIIDLLLERGADINSGSEWLCDCSRQQGLLNSVESPDMSPDPPKWSPLHLAICHSHVATAKLLLARGASHLMELENTQHGSAYVPGSATALHQAAAVGLVDLVEYLVKDCRIDVDVQHAKKLTPFYHAYANRRWDSTVPQLLALGANINVDTDMFLPYSTITPLGEACRLGDFAEADRLIDLGADVMHGFIATQTGGGLSPLHMCCMSSARLARGAPPRFYEEEGTGVGRMKTIGKLIAKGAAIEARDCSGDTPLIAAVQNLNVPAIRAVVSAGANIHERNSIGRNALMQAIVGPATSMDRIHFYTEPFQQILPILLSSGARVTDVDKDGNTVLHLVFLSNRPEHFQLAALRQLLDVPGVAELARTKNKANHTPLHMALSNGFMEACEILVRKGSFRRRLCREETFEMLQSALACDVIVQGLEFVLDIDVDRYIISSPSLVSTLLSTPCAVEAAGIIFSRGCGQYPASDSTHLMCLAMQEKQFRVAYNVLEAGADPNAYVESGEHPLAIFFASTVFNNLWPPASRNVPQLFQALLDHGANIHLPHSIEHPQRLLSWIIAQQLDELLDAILSYRPLGSDPRAANGLYLHEAVRVPPPSLPARKPPSEKIIDRLIAAGADCSEVDGQGDTPLSLLLKGLTTQRNFLWRYHRFIKTLSGPGVDINRKNSQGRSIVDYLQELMQQSDGKNSFLMRRIQIVDAGSGKKKLRFLPKPQKRVRPRDVMGRAWTI